MEDKASFQVIVLVSFHFHSSPQAATVTCREVSETRGPKLLGRISCFSVLGDVQLVAGSDR